MPSAAPIALLIATAGLLLIGRPYLEARLPRGTYALAAGIALGPSLAKAIPLWVMSEMEPLLALAAGWLALAAAEAWDLSTLRRAGWRRVAPILGALLLVAVIMILALYFASRDGASGSAEMFGAAVLLASAAIAVDPAAARQMLRDSHMPGPTARLAPLAASVALGIALAGSSLAAGGDFSISSTILRSLIALSAGALLGLLFVGATRRAEGKGMLLALMASLSLMGWGIAAALGMSPLAILFSAGVVLANDAAKRDLVFALLRELERPVWLAVLLLGGAAIPMGVAIHGAAILLPLCALFVAARMVALKTASLAGAGLRPALPMSALVIPLGLVSLAWPGRALVASGLAAVLAGAYIACEAIWSFTARHQRRQLTDRDEAS